MRGREEWTLFYAGEDAFTPFGSSHIVYVLAELRRTKFGTPVSRGAETPASVFVDEICRHKQLGHCLNMIRYIEFNSLIQVLLVGNALKRRTSET